MVLVEEEKSREYLERTLLTPSLEVGIEEMLRQCTALAEQGQQADPIAFLATWLMRNNPNKSSVALEKITAQRSATKQRGERQAAEWSKAESRAREAAEAHENCTLELKHPFGTLSLNIEHGR